MPDLIQFLVGDILMKRAVLIILATALFSLNTAIADEFTTKMETIFSSEKEYVSLQHVKSAIDSNDNIHCVFMNSDGNSFYGTNQNGEWKFEKLQYLDVDEDETFDVTKYPNMQK
jgi:hypothetical protein